MNEEFINSFFFSFKIQYKSFSMRFFSIYTLKHIYSEVV